ncbi:MAG: hypothetical protein EON58_12735, partial [Alphaproteobacteria bacterium]
MDPLVDYDCLIFLKGLPKGFLVGDTHWGVGTFIDTSKKVLANIAAQDCHFESFLKGSPTGDVMAFISRTTEKERNDAIGTMLDRLDYVLDCYSTIADSPIKRSSVILVREAKSLDVQLLHVERGGFAKLHSKTPVENDQWKARNRQLFNQLLQYIDLRNGEEKGDELLTQDLFHALRMYRLGSESSSHGLEFLAKFSALECLVCGPQRDDRGRLLKSRLSNLLSDEDFYSESLVEKLWELRCLGSHQSRVSEHSLEDHHMPGGVAAIHVEQMFSCVLYFFLDNLKTVKNLDELWTKAGPFS